MLSDCDFDRREEFSRMMVYQPHFVDRRVFVLSFWKCVTSQQCSLGSQESTRARADPELSSGCYGVVWTNFSRCRWVQSLLQPICMCWKQLCCPMRGTRDSTFSMTGYQLIMQPQCVPGLIEVDAGRWSGLLIPLTQLCVITSFGAISRSKCTAQTSLALVTFATEFSSALQRYRKT